MAERSRAWRVAVVVGLAAALAAGVFLVVRQAQERPRGPQPIAWDRAACAHCRMLVSEPRFAAQLIDQDGRVLAFDDPGCLLSWVNGHLPGAAVEVWFHHLHEERWVSAEQVRFISTSPTPMGFGLGATGEPAAGSLSYEEALRRVAERSPGGGH